MEEWKEKAPISLMFLLAWIAWDKKGEVNLFKDLSDEIRLVGMAESVCPLAVV